MTAAAYTATAYGPPWNAMEGTGVTSTGVDLTKGQRYVVAVDPRVIPYHSKLKIWPNPFGDPNIVFSAEDTGGAIKGNRIDFFVASGRPAQNAWGRRRVNVQILGHGHTPAAAAASATPTPKVDTASLNVGQAKDLFSPQQHHDAVYALLFVGLILAGVMLAYKGADHSSGGALSRASRRAGKLALAVPK